MPTPSTSGDGGGQGVALDPDFDNTDYVYYTENSGEFNEIIRFIGVKYEIRNPKLETKNADFDIRD